MEPNYNKPFYYAALAHRRVRRPVVGRRATFEIRSAAPRDSRRRRPRGRTRREGIRRETDRLHDVGLRGRHGWRPLRRLPRPDLSPVRLRPHLRHLHRADVHLRRPRNPDRAPARRPRPRVDAAVLDDSILERLALPDHLRRALPGHRAVHAPGHRGVSDRLAFAPGRARAPRAPWSRWRRRDVAERGPRLQGLRRTAGPHTSVR